MFATLIVCMKMSLLCMLSMWTISLKRVKELSPILITSTTAYPKYANYVKAVGFCPPPHLQPHLTPPPSAPTPVPLIELSLLVEMLIRDGAEIENIAHVFTQTRV